MNGQPSRPIYRKHPVRNRSFMRRIILGVTGQATFRGVTALGSVLVIPALIHGWGVRGYGEWIALTALLSYMAYSNFGIVSTSMSEMIMASAAEDYERAARVFQMSINLIVYVIAPLLLCFIIIVDLSPALYFLKLTTINHTDAAIITDIVAAQFVLLTTRGILIAILYSAGSYGFVYYLLSGTKLCELVGISLGVVLFGFHPLQAAMVSAGIACLEVVIIGFLARRASSWMRINLRVFDLDWIASQARPAFGFALGNLATQGILIQGARVLLNVTLGGGAVAVYAIYGTAMRLVDQLLQMIALPLEVEMAHSLGRNEPGQTRRLVALGTQTSWLMFAGVSTLLLLFGSTAFHWWTAGKIVFSRSFMALYLCISMASLLGRISNHALISTNRQYGPSFVTVAWSLAAIGLGALLIVPLKLTGMVIAAICGEFGNSLVAIFFVSRLLNCSVGALFSDMLDFRRSFTEIRRRLAGLMAKYRPA